MEGSWHDEEFIYFGDTEVEMMQHIRRYMDENGKSPSENEFDEYENTTYSTGEIKQRFGHWENVIEGVGGDPNPRNGGRTFEPDETRSQIQILAEQSLEYEVEGTEVTSPEGEAVPYSHLEHIEHVFDMPESLGTIKGIFGKGYLQLVKDLGYDHPRQAGEIKSSQPTYDWSEVRNKLRDDIESHVTWRNEEWDEGEIPTWPYFNNRAEYPCEQSLRRKIGVQKEWKEELGITTKRTAKDVNVNPKKFGL